MRPLTLHASALNDEEYEVYTAALQDLTWAGNDEKDARDDKYYEDLRMSVREVRGWVRGRYPSMAPGIVDSILRMFSSELRQDDVLAGGQTFAALRLVAHAVNGRDVDRALAFVQAYPKQGARSSKNPFVMTAKSAPTHLGANPTGDSMPSRLPPLPPRKVPVPSPVPPPRHASTLPRRQTSPMRPAFPLPLSLVPSGHPPSSTPVTPFPAIPPKAPAAHVTSALMKQSLQASKVGQTLKRAEEQLEQERVLQVLKSSSIGSGGYSLAGATITRSSITIGTNVVTRSTGGRSTSPPRPPYSTSGSEDSLVGAGGVSGRAPPLPKRRNTGTNSDMNVTSPSTASVSSFEQVALASAPQPLAFNRTSTFAKGPTPPSVQTVPRRSHSEFFISDTTGHTRLPPPPPIPSKHGSPTRTHSDSPNQSSSTNPSPHSCGPPPTHPDRKPLASPARSSVSHTPDSETSPTARVFRSKSLHYPSPSSSASLPPLGQMNMSGRGVGMERVKSPPHVPPPQRKRPESVQVVRGPSTASTDDPKSLGPSLSRRSSLSSTGGMHHRSSLSTSSTVPSTHAHGESPFAKIALSLQPKIEALQLQPRFEKARFKAEAGLSRRGYIKEFGTEEGLLPRRRATVKDGENEGKPQRATEWDLPTVDSASLMDPDGDDARKHVDQLMVESRAEMDEDDSQDEREREGRNWERGLEERWGRTNDEGDYDRNWARDGRFPYLKHVDGEKAGYEKRKDDRERAGWRIL